MRLIAWLFRHVKEREAAIAQTEALVKSEQLEAHAAELRLRHALAIAAETYRPSPVARSLGWREGDD